ncbi:hypothetical protein EG329_013817 [Mollisiaceae sp. DMI_Dod_QoI]|nr:hypothetical protein EG329_013817 [Helotiales sp. DMI_Dod_QoI]
MESYSLKYDGAMTPITIPHVAIDEYSPTKSSPKDAPHTDLCASGQDTSVMDTEKHDSSVHSGNELGRVQHNAGHSISAGQFQSTAVVGTMVPVPSDILNLLLTSVEGLKREMALVQTELAVVKDQNLDLQIKLTATYTDLRLLQKNLGVFYLFPKLPPDVRRLIWQEALNVPRIITLDAYSYPSSIDPGIKLISNAMLKPPNPLRTACKEARAEAINFQTSWFSKPNRSKLSSKLTFKESPLASHPKNDILWLVEPEDWCADSDNFLQPWNSWASNRIARAFEMHNAQPSVIAFSFHHWTNLVVWDRIKWLMHALKTIETQQIIVVLDIKIDPGKSVSGDLVFIESEQQPEYREPAYL